MKEMHSFFITKTYTDNKVFYLKYLSLSCTNPVIKILFYQSIIISKWFTYEKISCNGTEEKIVELQ
jgi:hypothetical protein